MQREKLQNRLNSVDIHFVDFVHKCLTVNPKDRITPEQVGMKKNPINFDIFECLTVNEKRSYRLIFHQGADASVSRPDHTSWLLQNAAR